MSAKCGAKNRSGSTCGLPEGWGTDHVGHGRCRIHGGNTPSGRQQGHRQAAQAAVATYGIGGDGTDDPVEALLQELRRSTAAVAFIEDQITALDPDQLIRGTRSVRRTVHSDPAGAGDVTTTVTEAGTLTSPWLGLLQWERVQLARVSSSILQHGLDELALQIEKQAVTDLVGVIRGILDDLQLSTEQQALVPDVVPRRLRALRAS